MNDMSLRQKIVNIDLVRFLRALLDGGTLEKQTVNDLQHVEPSIVTLFHIKII
jgi:hypothetical protein